MKIAGLERNKFIELFGPLYENSAFIAEEIYQRGLEKYQDSEEVFISMRNLVDEMEYKAKLQLILEHPELGIRKQDTSRLTKHSQVEQKGAGLDRLNEDEFENLKSLNDTYMRKFNFPFIIAVGGLIKYDFFKNMMERLENKYDQEFQTAIDEIHKIAKIRLDKIT